MILIMSSYVDEAAMDASIIHSFFNKFLSMDEDVSVGYDNPLKSLILSWKKIIFLQF